MKSSSSVASAGHDGGDMAFSPEGLLYITTGDGTSDSDGWDSGQTLDDLLGEVLRIDVDRPARRERRHAAYTQSRPTTRSSTSPAPGPRSGPMACAIPGECRSTRRRARSGSEQRTGPVGDGPPDPPRRQLRLERLRGEPSLLPGTASSGPRRR